MIKVTKTYLPDFDEYTSILRRAWKSGWITNNGELVQELETKLKEYLGVNNLWFTSNGTVVLQMALKALNITKEVITTPFSYVATTNAILWQGCTPVFVDIDPSTFCIDASKIEAAITPDTQAILATHVYGLPCNVEAIDSIAKKYGLKVIYDGAHAFGCSYKGRSLLSYGDISTCSFHATKLFHTVEGGCVIATDPEVSHQLMLYRQFGHIGDAYFTEGINAKNSEFHAAMGLAVLPKVEELMMERKVIFDLYQLLLPKHLEKINYDIAGFDFNFSYFPVLFKSEAEMLAAKQALQHKKILARRYFYPSLNSMPQVIATKQICPISEDISERILCIPIYAGLTTNEINLIASTINQAI